MMIMMMIMRSKEGRVIYSICDVYGGARLGLLFHGAFQILRLSVIPHSISKCQFCGTNMRWLGFLRLPSRFMALRNTI